MSPVSTATLPLAPADRAALARMAKGESRAALRAKAVLALADGAGVSEAAASLGLTRKTVRAARDRFLAGGVGGLSPRHWCYGARPTPPMEFPLTGLPRIPGGRGRLRGRLAAARIVAWVRDCAALGFLLRGVRLPERIWFAKRFRTTSHAVQRAFDDLVSQGFVRTVPRGGSFVPESLPFDGRFLLVLEEPLPDGTSGCCTNLEEAARRTEALRPGIRWDVVWRAPGTLPVIQRDLVAQRYCGVFLRFVHSSTWVPGKAEIASIPNVPMASDTIYPGTAVSPLVRMVNASKNESFPDLFAALRRAGRRRIALADIGDYRRIDREDEDEVRRLAAEAGVKIVEDGYIVPHPSDVTENILRIMKLLMATVRPGDIDAIVVRRDDLLKPLAAALREKWGWEAAARIPVVTASVGRLLPTEGLNVEWRAPDLVATFLSFIDWCQAIRSGDRDAPAPEVVW